MSIVDFFCFPIETASEASIFDLLGVDFHSAVRIHKESGAEHPVFALFDSEVVCRHQHVEEMKALRSSGEASFLYMPPLEVPRGLERIGAAAHAGCVGIVLHPYLQKIGPEYLGTVRRLSATAAEMGMITVVCAAYGGRDIFRYYPLESVVAAAESSDLPIVVAHAGGEKILEAFLIADSFPNVYLETSFSLPFWLGSPVEYGFAFAMSRLGASRFLFGSDAPFQEFRAALEAHERFFQSHGISDEDRAAMLGGTAEGILESVGGWKR